MQKNKVSPWLLGIGLFVIVLVLLFGCAAAGPSGLQANAVAGGIQVSWEPSSAANVAGYNIYKSSSEGTTGTKINSVMLTSTSYKDTSVEDEKKYYYTVRAVTTAGAEDSNTQQVSATAKTRPPQSLQININGGKEYTGTVEVSLYLSADGAYQCRFSNDETVWSNWEGYATTKSWSLAPGDGQKDVYYQCKDEVGNVAAPATASIYLDTTTPQIVMASPQQGAQYTSPFNLYFTATDPDDDTVTCSGDVDSSPLAIGVVDTGKEQSLSITAKAGTHTLNLKCSDGLSSGEATATFTVIDKPSVEIHIESGAGYVAIPRITLDVDATNAAQCRFSNDQGSWGNWLQYSTTVQWSLTGPDGTKVVYAQCQDNNGQLSDVASDSVVLDTTPPPYISVDINNGDAWTNSRNVVLGLYAFAAKQCQFSNDGQLWSGWEQYYTSRVWTLSPGEGTKYVYFQCQDKNGALVGSASASIKYSQKEPNPPSQLSLEINGGDDYTSSRNVELSIYAKDANECRFSDESTDWASWQDYDTRKSWRLSSGDGRKTVYCQCRNDFGSVDARASIYLETGPPGPINNLRATSDDDYIYLKWSQPSGDVRSYNVYRSTEGLGMFTLVGSTSSTSWRDGNVVEGLTYSYSVRAVNKAGDEGPNSNVVTAQTTPFYGPVI